MDKIINALTKNFLLLVFSLFLTHALSAQQSAKDLFINMPDSVCPLLTSVNRADCIDFLESNMRARVENRFRKTSEMTSLSKDFIEVKMTENSTWQMKVLPVNDSTQVICVVSTVCAPVCDSDIQFYSDHWQLLPRTTYLPFELSASDFLLPGVDVDTSLFVSAWEAVDMQLLKIDLNKENNHLTFTLSTLEYIEKEKAEKLLPFLRQSIVYDWNNQQFLPLQTSVDE